MKSWNLEKILDPDEIRAKKISQGRQDLQDQLDRRAFGLRESRRRERGVRRDYLKFSFSAFSAFSAVNCYVSFSI